MIINIDMSNLMNGETIQNYIKAEVSALVEKYTQFESIIPNASEKGGSDHNHEDGCFVEALLRDSLRKFLPKSLEVFTGFIVRPAVKVGNNRTRKGKKDKHSGQIDIIVYDSTNYPIYYQSGDTAIVPQEGVIAIISVKKTLKAVYVKEEARKLCDYSQLCRSDEKGALRRGPFLALVAMCSMKCNAESCYNALEKAYQEDEKDKKELYFDDVIGYVGVLREWSIIKKRPSENNEASFARFVGFKHKEEVHMGLQFLLNGIMSVFYDESRSEIKRPGFTAFPKCSDVNDLGKIKVSGLRICY